MSRLISWIVKLPLNRAIYESYLTRYKQTIEQDGIATAEARMISRAIPAKSKASPRLPVWLALGGIGGICFGWREFPYGIA